MKRGTVRHPKMADLIEALGGDQYRAVAIGSLELLWHFAAEFAPHADVGKYSDRRIEAAMAWTGSAGSLVSALRATKWLEDHPDENVRLVIHDWHDHCEDSVKKRVQRSGKPFYSLKPFQSVRDKLTELRQESSENVADRQLLSDDFRLPLAPRPSPLAIANASRRPEVSAEIPPTAPEPGQNPSMAASTLAPMPLNGHAGDYPLTLAEIRKHIAAVDAMDVCLLAQITVQHCQSQADIPDAVTAKYFGDKALAAACRESFKTGPPDHGFGLLRRNVPKIMATGLAKVVKNV